MTNDELENDLKIFNDSGLKISYELFCELCGIKEDSHISRETARIEVIHEQTIKDINKLLKFNHELKKG
jgi:hypothetical protein